MDPPPAFDQTEGESEFAIRFLAAGFHHVQASHQAQAVMGPDQRWILVLDAGQLAVHGAADLESILRQIFSQNDLDIRECGGSA